MLMADPLLLHGTEFTCCCKYKNKPILTLSMYQAFQFQLLTITLKYVNSIQITYLILWRIKRKITILDKLRLNDILFHIESNYF